ncbi:MAG: phosphate ABC transporter permease PstA [Nitrospinales bacterium]
MMERAFKGLLFLFTLGGCAILLVILVTVFWKGFPAIDLEFLTAPSRDFGTGGGIFYQLLGTMILMAGAAVVSLPIALGAALFQTEYVRSLKIKKFLRILIYSLNGVPTIIFGLIGYLVFGVFLETGVSWITGALILAVMILPTLQVSIQEAIESLPNQYREAGLAMGLTPWQLIQTVIIPQSVFGIVTGLLLGLARAAGETAAIMFTATTFSGALLPSSLTEPVTTLQTHILILAQEAVNPQALENAWGAALVLLGLVFALILGALLIRVRLKWEAES